MAVSDAECLVHPVSFLGFVIQGWASSITKLHSLTPENGHQMTVPSLLCFIRFHVMCMRVGLYVCAACACSKRV